MTHNTRGGIEEIVEFLLEELSYGGRKNYLDDTMGMDTAREILRTTLHQELQKAREEERERILLAIARIGKIDFRLSDVLDAINQSDKKCIMKKIEEYNEVMTQEELQALTQPNNK